MKRKGIYISVLCLLWAVLLLGPTAGKAAAGSISDAQQEKEALENQLEEAQELIDSLSDSKEDMEANVQQLDEKLTEISEEITALELKLDQKESMITDTREALAEARADVKSQYESMKVRIRFIYENSSVSYLETLLSAGSFGEMLNRVEYIRQLSEYDRNMLEKYKNTVNEVAGLETALEEERASLAEMKAQVQAQQDTVAALLKEKEYQLAELGEELTEAEQLAQVYEAEIQAQNEIIAMIQAEEARRQAEEAKRQEEEAKRQEEEAKRQEEANGGEPQEPQEPQEPEGPSFDGGVFTWPCPSSTRITSDYGPRNSPTAGASSYHRGLDIGASYGADIVAAADGVVSFAGYSYASGNYLTISHGNGLYTVYMHCSSLVAGKGDTVAAGQTVAKVGSTGISTGNHLHFGVSLNGGYVNPWDYLK